MRIYIVSLCICIWRQGRDWSETISEVLIWLSLRWVSISGLTERPDVVPILLFWSSFLLIVSKGVRVSNTGIAVFKRVDLISIQFFPWVIR